MMLAFIFLNQIQKYANGHLARNSHNHQSLQYSLLYALRKSNVVDDEEIEKALLKAQMKFDELRLKFSSTSGMC